MSSPRRNLVCRFTQILSLLLLTAMTWPGVAPAAQLGASWTDNSTNEAGFKIERMTGTTGTFAQVATVGANTSAYTDPNLSAGTTYCYRARAYNAAGDSAYSNQACGTAAVASFTLTVTMAGSGSGTVSSTPAG